MVWEWPDLWCVYCTWSSGEVVGQEMRQTLVVKGWGELVGQEGAEVVLKGWGRAGSSVEGVGQGAGSSVEGVGQGAGSSIEGVGQGAGSSIEGVGQGAGSSIEGVGQCSSV